MSRAPRYLWGDTKVGFVTFKARTSLAAKAGRMYFDSNLGFSFCEDGTSFLQISDVLHN